MSARRERSAFDRAPRLLAWGSRAVAQMILLRRTGGITPALRQPRRNFVQADQVLVTLTRPNRSKSGAVDQRLWREQAGIVCSRLNRAIGAGGHYRQKVALRRLGKLAIERQIVAALADRPDHVGANA